MSENSLVAMDFSGRIGRVIDNPLEAQSAAMEEGNAWRVSLFLQHYYNLTTMLLLQWFYNNNTTLLQRNYVTAMLLQRDHNATTTLLRYYNDATTTLLSYYNAYMTLWSERKLTSETLVIYK